MRTLFCRRFLALYGLHFSLQFLCQTHIFFSLRLLFFETFGSLKITVTQESGHREDKCQCQSSDDEHFHPEGISPCRSQFTLLSEILLFSIGSGLLHPFILLLAGISDIFLKTFQRLFRFALIGIDLI